MSSNEHFVCIRHCKGWLQYSVCVLTSINMGATRKFRSWGSFPIHVGFDVLTAGVLKSSAFSDIMPYSPLKVNRTLLRNISPPSSGTKNKLCLACHLLSFWFLDLLILRTWRWRQYVAPKHRLTFNGLYGVLSQKMWDPFENRCIKFTDTKKIKFMVYSQAPTFHPSLSTVNNIKRLELLK
jgi:hypothetical protein